MNEREGFLRSIIVNPADDLPRLVFADWLDEHNEPSRAEFIRVQIALGKWPGDYRPQTTEEDSEQWRLVKRAQELIDADLARSLRWFGLPAVWAKIVRLTPFDIDDVLFPYGIARRGFLDCFTMGPRAWFNYGDIVRERHPVVTVRLIERPEFDYLELGHCSQEVRSADGPARLVPMQTVRAAVADRPIVLPPLPPGTDSTLPLLEARWPGIKFELPTVPSALAVYEMAGVNGPDSLFRQFHVRGTESNREAGRAVGIPINAPHHERPDLRVSRIDVMPAGEGEWAVAVFYQRPENGEGHQA